MKVKFKKNFKSMTRLKIKYFGYLIFTRETITPTVNYLTDALKESKLLIPEVENTNKMLMN